MHRSSLLIRYSPAHPIPYLSLDSYPTSFIHPDPTEAKPPQSRAIPNQTKRNPPTKPIHPLIHTYLISSHSFIHSLIGRKKHLLVITACLLIAAAIPDRCIGNLHHSTHVIIKTRHCTVRPLIHQLIFVSFGLSEGNCMREANRQGSNIGGERKN